MVVIVDDAHLHVVEVVELHGGGEVKEEACEVGALGGQLVQHRVGDNVHWHLQVAQGSAEPCAAQHMDAQKRGGRVMSIRMPSEYLH